METKSRIYLFPLSDDPNKGGFESADELKTYIEKGLLDPKNGKCEWLSNERKFAERIVLAYRKKIYGYLDVGDWHKPSREDIKRFPPVRTGKVYVIDAAVLFNKPVELATIEEELGKKLHNVGLPISEGVFKQIERLGQPLPPILRSPPQEAESDDKKSDGELSEKFSTIRQRLRDGKFRKRLEDAYGGPRCAITKCAVEDALEGAHIKPHSQKGPDVPSNGLLLRCDIHALFDAGLLAIHPDTHRVALADVLLKTDYREYEGREIEKPKKKSDYPDVEALRIRWSAFKGNAPSKG